MAAERNYGRDSAAFCQGGGEEYGQEAVTSIVAGTADAVHDFGAADVSGVNVTIDVNFDSGVHSDNADTTSNFRAVSNFLRTEDDVFFVFFNVVVEFFEAFRRRGQCSTGANAEFASVDQVEHTVLDNFGVNGEVFEVGVNEAIDNCVSNGTYARLQRQQVFRQAASSNFSFEEFYQVFAHSLSVFVDSAERTNFVGDVASNNSNEFFEFAGDVRGANDGTGVNYRDGLTARRIQGNIGVMHAFESYRLSYVNFYDNLFSGLNEGRAVAHGSGRDQAYFAFAEVDNFANFYDCNVNVTTVFIETITGHLSNVGQVQVGIFYFTAVDSFTHIVVGLVGQTTVNYVNQCRVHFGTYGCASPEVDFERSGFSSFSESQRNSFRVARRGKTRGTYVVAILYEFCSSFSRHNFASYYVTNAIFNIDHVYFLLILGHFVY